MKRLILSIIFLSSLVCNGQVSKFRLTISNSSSEDSTCYKIYIFTNTDTIYSKFIYADYEHEFDSLLPSRYKIHLYNCSDLKEIAISKSFTLLPDKFTKVSIDNYFEETHSEMNKKTRDEIVKDRVEVGLNLSYFQSNWINEKSALKFSTSIGFTEYKWFSFSKHVGILAGAGLGLSHHSFYKDTTFISFSQNKKRYEYYNYFAGQGDLKLRFTIGNQQNEKSVFRKPIFDIGVVYYAPIVFKHIARYDNKKKVTNSGLHQFTDLRAYVNIGFSPLMLFFEYRLTDYIIGNYPELSKYNTGIRLIMQ